MMCPQVAETRVWAGRWGGAGCAPGDPAGAGGGALPRAAGSPAEAGRAQSRWREAGSAAAGAQEPPGGAGVRDPGEVAAPAEAEGGRPSLPPHRPAASPARISVPAAQTRPSGTLRTARLGADLNMSRPWRGGACASPAPPSAP